MGSAAMDEWFGEPVHLIPWKESSFTSGADPDRAEADFVAIVGGAMSTQNLGGGNSGGGSNYAGTATT